MYDERQSENYRLRSIEERIEELKAMVRDLTTQVTTDRLGLARGYVSREEYRDWQRETAQRIATLWRLFWALIIALIGIMGTLVGRMLQGV